MLTPLSYKLAVNPAEKGWRDAFTKMGILAPRDFVVTEPTIIGLYGGYGYLNLSYLRIARCACTGIQPRGHRQEPVRRGQSSAVPTAQGRQEPALLVEDAADRNEGVVAESYRRRSPIPRARASTMDRSPPVLSASNEELLAFLHEYRNVFAPVFENHMITTFTASIVGGMLYDGATAAGDRTSSPN